MDRQWADEDNALSESSVPRNWITSDEQMDDEDNEFFELRPGQVLMEDGRVVSREEYWAWHEAELAKIAAERAENAGFTGDNTSTESGFRSTLSGPDAKAVSRHDSAYDDYVLNGSNQMGLPSEFDNGGI